MEPQVAWSNYLRTLLKVECVYRFLDLQAGLYFIIAEHKSFANREVATKDAAIGRPLSVAWLEKKESATAGD